MSWTPAEMRDLHSAMQIVNSNTTDDPLDVVKLGQGDTRTLFALKVAVRTLIKVVKGSTQEES